MKKVINGRLYNTETAKEVGRYWNGLCSRDFQHYEEVLYEKKTGEFFLYGIGGPMSPYNKTCGQNCWSGGEKIIPLTVDEAKRWTEESLDADDYIRIFGDVEE